MQEPIRAISFISNEIHETGLPGTFPEINFKDNCLIVYAAFLNQSFVNLEENVIIEIRKKILIGHNPYRKYYFDCLHEGIVLPVVSTIHKIIKGFIKSTNVYYFTGALNGKEIYDEYVIRADIISPIHIMINNAWEGASNQLRFPGKYQIKNKEKLFLSYNRVVRPQRTAFLGLLEDRGLREKAYYSYLGGNHGNVKIDIDSILNDVKFRLSHKSFQIIEKNFRKLIPFIPLKLNIDPEINMTWFLESDFEYFENSYFSFVTETIFFPMGNDLTKEHVVFFSEKIFKPIIMKHPFILASSAHSLEYLRKEEYKTFHPYINETYDTINNSELRMLAIVDEIERLSTQTNEEWIKWQENVKDIVEYNYRIFQLKSRTKWKKHINDKDLLE